MTDRIGRFRFMDQQRVNLDGFAVPDSALGLLAYDSPGDPEPSLVVSDGVVVEMDSRTREDFDLLDTPAADQTYMQLGFSTLDAAAAQADALTDTQPDEPADTTDTSTDEEATDGA